MVGRVVIIMGSKSDLEHASGIVAQLDAWGVPHTVRVASAHKAPRYLLELLDHYNAGEEPIVFITIAGRSNALGGLVDANTTHPVITCPPVSAAFGGADVYSSLRMPSGVAPMLVLDPQGAALAAAKMLSLVNPDLRARIALHQEQMLHAIVAADQSLNP
ncbi:MAG: AIR carboxylase family protein [Anaerolineae bacterium]